MHLFKYFFLSVLVSVFFVSCEKDDTSIIDPVLHFPQIDSAFVTPKTFDTSAVNVSAYAKVTSEEAIRNVTATIKDPVSFERTIILKDDGVFPDSVAGDGWYSGSISFTMTCRLVGSYDVKFVAENVSGLFSPQLSDNFNVINTNNISPLISDLIIPDSLQRPSSGFNVAFLQLRATDQNGQCDILDAHFTTRRPNGSTDGVTYFMYDDGFSGHCDTVQNDTKYSLCVNIGNTAQLGYYKFIFNARDRSLALSDTLRDSIYVYQ